MTTNAILLAQADTDPGFKVPGAAKDDKGAGKPGRKNRRGAKRRPRR